MRDGMVGRNWATARNGFLLQFLIVIKREEYKLLRFSREKEPRVYEMAS